jgi:membrane-associated phospholipid phosphatase
VAAAVFALAAAVGMHLTWWVFVATRAGQQVEEYAFDGAAHGQYRLWTIARPVLDVVSVSFVVLGIVAAMTVCAVRRRWVLAAQVAVLIAGSNGTTQIVKHWIYDRPHLLPGWNRPNSLPSGHTTVAMSVSVGLLIAVPRTWRPTVAVLGAGWTAATGISTLVGQWHTPADVVAAVLIVGVWGALVCALTTHATGDVVGPGGALAARSTVVAGALLGVIGAVSTLAAGLSLAKLWPGGGATRLDAGLIAYAGGVAGVVAVTAVVFAALLLVRQSTARLVS